MVVSQPKTEIKGLLDHLPISLRLAESWTMGTKIKGATKPLIIAEYSKAFIGSMPKKFISKPKTMAAMIVP